MVLKWPKHLVSNGKRANLALVVADPIQPAKIIARSVHRQPPRLTHEHKVYAARYLAGISPTMPGSPKALCNAQGLMAPANREGAANCRQAPPPPGVMAPPTAGTRWGMPYHPISSNWD